MKIIFKFVVKTISFILNSVEIDNKNGDTRISLNLNGLLKRVIYACLSPFIN